MRERVQHARVAHLSDLHVLGSRASEVGEGGRSARHAMSMRFVSFGRPLDASLRRRKLLRALESAKAAGASCFVLTGDLTELGLPDQFEALAEVLHASRIDPHAFVLVPGNHDLYSRAGPSRTRSMGRFGRSGTARRPRGPRSSSTSARSSSRRSTSPFTSPSRDPQASSRAMRRPRSSDALRASNMTNDLFSPRSIIIRFHIDGERGSGWTGYAAGSISPRLSIDIQTSMLCMGISITTSRDTKRDASSGRPLLSKTIWTLRRASGSTK